MRWFIPSFYGDLSLERGDEDKTCVLMAEKVTETERQALSQLEKICAKKKWLPEGTIIPHNDKTLIRGPLDDVAKQLAKLMKPGRQILSVVKFADGSMREIHDAAIAGAANEAYRTAAGKEEPKAAASVATPTRGCPAPDFDRAELRATRVLEHFLDQQQLSDFRRYNRFVVVGEDSGHHYMVTSRNNRDDLANYQRSLFDLDENEAICVHDWAIPAPEEMLTLSTLLQVPGWESWMRRLPEEPN